MWDLWLRPDQRIPRHAWRTCGFDGGRGYGKSVSICAEINRRVKAGTDRHILLMAPTEERVEKMMIPFLIATAPPWEAPVPYRGGLLWPNGATALAFTPEAPGRVRGENASLSWCTELVDWNEKTRSEAFANLSFATRKGQAQILWDSTNKGRNDLLQSLRDRHERDPQANVIIGGQMFDNYLWSTLYTREAYLEHTGVRRREEIFGEHFAESEGALWAQADLDKTRVTSAPELERTLVAIDPAQSTGPDADERGLMCGGRARDGHAYATHDLSGRYPPEGWGDAAIDAALVPLGNRIVIERNHLGDHAVYLLRSRATERGVTVDVVPKGDPWPPYNPRVLHVREVIGRESKGARAEGPAAETNAGRAHIVGDMPDLERELTTWVPGSGRRSPNRLDAFAYLITDLRDLAATRKPDRRGEVMGALAATRTLATATAGRGRRGMRF
jgi:phage terminase large subunit-like protein